MTKNIYHVHILSPSAYDNVIGCKEFVRLRYYYLEDPSTSSIALPHCFSLSLISGMNWPFADESEVPSTDGTLEYQTWCFSIFNPQDTKSAD